MRRPILSPDVVRQLRKLRAGERRSLLHAMQERLAEEDPTVETRNRFRLRRTSTHADYELRAGDLRAFFRVESDGQVYVALIGRKVGNRLLVEGEEFDL